MRENLTGTRTASMTNSMSKPSTGCSGDPHPDRHRARRHPLPAGEKHAARVVRLDAYREAVNAARFLLGCLHEPKWHQMVRAELAKDEEPQVLVALNWETPLIRRCLPTAVNGVRVVVREVDEPRPGGTG